MSNPLFFATLDPLRGMGMETKHSDFHLICYDQTDVVDMLINKGISVFCLEKEEPHLTVPRSTRDLLLHPKTQEFIISHSKSDIDLAVFKPTFDIERVLSKMKLGQSRTIISRNPSAVLTKKLENKLNFYDLCMKNNISHTPARKFNLHTLDASIFDNENYTVVQFERGWFGNRTFFLQNEQDLTALQSEYTDRTVLVSDFVEGTIVTNNFVATDSTIFQSYPFFQKNDTDQTDVPLSRLKGSTIGNAWEQLDPYFSDDTNEIITKIKQITLTIGTLLQKEKFFGYAGLDFIVSTEGNVYVQEINPRFTASVQMFTQLEQLTFGKSLLDVHFGLNTETNAETFFSPLSGARIIARNTQTDSVRIKNYVSNGRYQLKNNEYSFIDQSYVLEALQENQFLFFSAGKNRAISPDEEIFQLQSTSLSAESLQSLARKIKQSIL